MNKNNLQKGEIIIYKTPQGPEIKVKLEKDTVWLGAHLMAELFKVDRTVIVKHIRNIYKSKELSEKSTCAKIAQVAADGKIRKMNLYNLDVIISVGYRVNSKQATKFRIWATKVLKQFGQDNERKLAGILKNIYQTFKGKKIYPSLEEKAVHLLYFIIKDHPFVDGNKRIASFLFVYFLDKNNFLYRENGERKINDNALAALTFLIAVSEPKDKDILIKIITNLLS